MPEPSTAIGAAPAARRFAASALMASSTCSVMRGGRGHLRGVERRRDLDDVHARQLHCARDLAHRAKQLARQHAARLGVLVRAMPGSSTSMSTDR